MDAPESRNGSTVSTARAQEPRRRQEAATDDGQPIEALRRVVQVRPEEQGEGLPAHGRARRMPRADRRGRPPSAARDRAPAAASRRGRPNAGTAVGDRSPARASAGSPALAGAGVQRRERELERSAASATVGRRRRRAPPAAAGSSSARSVTTTTSASTTIRRLILDWPTRRSRNVIGVSTTRAPRARCAERHLDLEDVAAGVDAVERDRRKGRRAPRLEPAGQVVRPEAQHAPGEDAAATRDDPPAEAPVDDAAAFV